jgi:predicted nuclease of predicted toxin-antitoxin system
MRFLADENFPRAAVEALAHAGHDVVSIAAAAPGTLDTEVFRWAARENRIILTFDKDFGDIARGASLPVACGVILFRLPMPPSTEVGARLAKVIGDRSDWSGNFSVIESDRVRMRPLPKPDR